MQRTNGSKSVKDSIENKLIFNQGVGRRKRGGRKSVSLSVTLLVSISPILDARFSSSNEFVL